MTYGEPSFNYIWDKIKALLAKELGITQEEASAALIAARQAQSDSSYARTEADGARDYALQALQSARDAQADATAAHTAATNAQASAERAEAEAQRAGTAADNAEDKAEEARQSAVRANASANGALTQLSIVEKVLDVLNWITDHGTYTLTTDTTVDPTKTYFVNVGTPENPVYTPVEEPKDEELSTYYELEIDEALSNYVSSHLALTNDGLYVLNDNNSYKVLISNTGVEIQDSRGVPVAKYGENIQFSEDVAQYIGGENAYIVFDPLTESLTIGGNQVTFGNKSLSELLSDVSTASSQASAASSAVTTMQDRMDSGEFDATVVKIDSSHGNVFKNNSVSTVLSVSVYTGNLRITNQTDLVAKYGSTANIKWYWQRFGETDFHIIPSTDSKLSENGFKLTLTPDQVDVKITFIAELNI